DVDTVKYRIIDPDANVIGDEYYDYVITLKNGSARATTIPQYSSVHTMNERFGEIGLIGQALALVSMAEEDESEPPRSLGFQLLSWVAGLLGGGDADIMPVYTDAAESLPVGQWTSENLEGVF